jgi:hypothetical protein
MRTPYDPLKNDKLEERAKEMAEYYHARLDKMGINGVRACLARILIENPQLYALLAKEWRELYESSQRERRRNK